ncbi:hypothetical protein KUTeg_010585, partial [Tegillarca granosa]
MQLFKKRDKGEQHKHNNKVFVKLHEASDCLEGLTMKKATEAKTKISERMELIKTRQKLIKLAKSSKAGWNTAEEYSSNPLAEDLGDACINTDRACFDLVESHTRSTSPY